MDLNQTLESKIAFARSVSDEQFPPLPITDFHALLHKRMGEDSPFLIYLDAELNRVSFTYYEFCEMVFGVADYLYAKGFKKGDRIATFAHNHWQTIVHYFAAWYSGIVVVPINLSEDDSRIEYILQHGEVKHVFTHYSYQQRLEDILTSRLDFNAISITVFGDEFDYTTRKNKPECDLDLPQGDDDAFIVFTSGTTGNPKAVLLSQRNLLEDARAISEWHGINEHTRLMCVLPIHHVNGTVVTHITPFYQGSSVVLNQKFSVTHFWESVKKEKVHIVSMVPTLLHYLNSEYENKIPEVSELFSHVICGAGPLTVSVAKQFEETFNRRIIHGYGLSETTCYSCFLPLDLSDEEHNKWMRKHGYPSIGVAIPANEMTIHDSEGNLLKPGERGEIVIRGVNVMKEYYNNPEANKKAFTYGWFRSGDEGFYLTDSQDRRFYFITGRLKELIIRGGVNLAPLEIDEVINQIPGVKVGIAVGFENDWYGEEVGAYIQLEENVKRDEKTILDYCQKHLPYSKSPKVIVFGNQIPVTSTGKYQRIKVAHHFKKWKSIQFRK